STRRKRSTTWATTTISATATSRTVPTITAVWSDMVRGAKTAEAIRLAKRGIPPKEIASRLGMTQGSVIVTLSLARKRGEDIPLFTHWNSDTPRLVLAADAMEKLRAVAARRKTTVALLATRILTEVARYDMADAILDDED